MDHAQFNCWNPFRRAAEIDKYLGKKLIRFYAGKRTVSLTVNFTVNLYDMPNFTKEVLEEELHIFGFSLDNDQCFEKG